MFKKTSENLFYKNPKINDMRLGELVASVDSGVIKKMAAATAKKFILAGYADDEGIRNNGGRVGAKLAPPKIREFFYKMTPFQKVDFEILDIGDISHEQDTLEQRHQEAFAVASDAFQKGFTWIALGGGHDYAYADIAAFIVNCKQRPLIINFDAHLDVRSTEFGINSGTSFFRILEEFKDIDLIQIGIQSQCNSLNHFEYSNGQNVKVLRYDDIRLSGEGLTSYCLSRISELVTKRRKCFLSIDIDGFSNAYAPGCSQSFATGLHPDEFFQLTSILNHRLDIQGMGIYECSPPLDRDDQTSKLAALILHKFIFSI